MLTPAQIFGDCLSSMVDVETVTRDGYGNDPSAGPISYQCRISGKSRLVRDRNGQQVVASFKITVLGDNGFTTDQHLYTLPASYNAAPRQKAIAVKTVNDTLPATVHHQSIMLP